MKLMQLPLEKKGKGYFLKQILRNDKSAIYSIGFKNSDDNVVYNYGYEVIKIRIRCLSKTWRGHENLRDLGFTHMEVYPHDEEWGIYGYVYRDKEKAVAKYDQLSGGVKSS